MNRLKKNSKTSRSSKRARQNPTVRPRESFDKEAEGIVEEIRRGRAPGLVVQGAHGEKVVTLQGSDQPYRVLVESINDGAATLDAAGTIRYANSRFAEILDLPADKLVGTTLESNIPARWQADLAGLIDQAHCRSGALELTLDATESRPRLVRFTLKPLKNTPFHKICVVATELTELVEANEALKSNEESLRQLSARLLQIQDEERRHIARDLHDVTGQKLAFQAMALSGVLGRHSSNLDADAQQALSESLLLNKEVSAEIRTLSYLLHPPLLDELGLSSAARWYAAGFTKRTGIPIDVEIAPGLKRLSPDAEVAIFRVLQESLTNVHRYSNTMKARVSIHTTDREIRVEIEDFGLGIEPARSKSARKGVQRLGVGIQGMTERIRQLGGRLEITSKPNRGTLVSATIPLSSSRVSATGRPVSDRGPSISFVQNEEPASRDSQRKRILIADDHEMLRRGLRNTFQNEADLEICGEAVDGQDAIDKVKQLNPDLVILDINMPVLSGLVTVRQILRHRPEIKVVVFSVHDSDRTVQELRAAGAHAFLSKGEEAQALLRVVRALLKGNATGESAASVAPRTEGR